MNNRDDMDTLIKKAMIATMEEIHLPQMEEVWRNIDKDIQKKHRRPFLYRNLWAAVLLVVVFLAGGQLANEGYANYLRNMKIFTSITGDGIHVKMHNKLAHEMERGEGRPVEIDQPLLEEMEVSIEEAKVFSSFPIQEPVYMPQGYGVDKAILMQMEERTLHVKIVYGEGDEAIELLQEPTYGQYAASMHINPVYGKVIETSINGLNYLIIQFVDGRMKIHWDRNEMKFTLTGKLEQEEMMKIATSIP
ncbi:MAG: DUF4367 domain-containing protein [Thermotaleaceae bacterium]